MTTELTCWLRGVADPTDQKLLDEVIGYEYRIDGEWGDGCDQGVIERGGCREISPDDVAGVRLIASRYAHVTGYRADWRPDVRDEGAPDYPEAGR